MTMAVDAFVRTYPCPALRVVPPEVPSGLRSFFDNLDRGVQKWATQRVDDGGFLRYLEKAAFVTKRHERVAPRVSIGRAQSNDIVMTIGTVSKTHGYFTDEPTGWHFVDPYSTNGSWVGGHRLGHRQPIRLEDGCLIRFGQGTTLQFLLPPSLWEVARRPVDT
ncbi:MAG: FHA domain-containing protein [Acidobacteriota bacterium]